MPPESSVSVNRKKYVRDLTTVSVRDLAEFVHRRGDLHESGGRVTALEGVAGQSRLQAMRPETYQREVAFEEVIPVGKLNLTLRGRADGIDFTEGLIEEIKASRIWPDAARSEHRAQAMLYAALAARTTDARDDWRVQVTYVHPDSLESRTFTETTTAAELDSFLASTLHDWGAWVCARQSARNRRDAWLSTARFPMTELRPWQGAVMRRCADAISRSEALLLEAPTGSGKTLSVSWPAVRALPVSSRIFFLTARNTGAAAALHALELIDAGSGHVRRIALIAREKICPVPGTPCDPRVCERARGYYDRNRAAVEDVLSFAEATPALITTIAERHTVCPFELSLDAAVWFDVVVGDYNYVFDPIVRLLRFAGDKDAILLVDEAHQLSPRVRGSLSTTLARETLRTAMKLAPAPMARALRGVDRILQQLGKSVQINPAAVAARSASPRRSGPETPEQLVESMPDTFVAALERLVSASVEWQQDNFDPLPEPVQQAVFDAVRWIRLAPWFKPCAHAFLLEGAGTALTLHARCLDVGPWLQSIWKQTGPCIRFSATASPPELFQASHGVIDSGSEPVFARAGSPFQPSQIDVLIVPDIDTRWRRREQTLGRLSGLLSAVVAAKQGRYLFCFPSYRYLDQFAAHLHSGEFADRKPFSFIAEKPGDGASLLDHLASDDTVVLGIVLGGTLAESIDLIATPLSGILVVSVALPPPSAELERSAEHFNARGLDGRLMAYIQPGMSRIVQAAGRLIRNSDHRGVLVLVDDRFADPVWRQFFPDLWDVRTIPSQQVAAHVTEFWTRS